MSPYFATNLRRERRLRDLTQADLAARIEAAGGPKLSRFYLSALERGLRPTDPGHVEAIAAALGTSSPRLRRRPRTYALPELATVTPPAPALEYAAQ